MSKHAAAAVLGCTHVDAFYLELSCYVCCIATPQLLQAAAAPQAIHG